MSDALEFDWKREGALDDPIEMIASASRFPADAYHFALCVLDRAIAMAKEAKASERPAPPAIVAVWARHAVDEFGLCCRGVMGCWRISGPADLGDIYRALVGCDAIRWPEMAREHAQFRALSLFPKMHEHASHLVASCSM